MKSLCKRILALVLCAAMAASLVPGVIMYALMLFISDSEDCTAVIRSLRHKSRKI